MGFVKEFIVASPTLVVGLLWCLLLLLFVPPTYSENECTFVKSYHNQECVYNIHLTQTSGDCHVPRGRSRHFRRHLPGHKRAEIEAGYLDGGEEEGEGGEDEDDFQNDYVRKVDNMEKTFSYMKDEHDKRLQDLEGSVRDLLSLDLQPSSFRPSPAYNSPSSKSASSPSSKSSSLASLFQTSVQLTNKEQGTGTQEQGKGSLNANILDRLHDEFGKLRDELRQKTEQLFEAQIKTNETVHMLEKSQVDIFSVNQDLLTSQHKIAVLERERAVLHNQLKDRNYKLDIASNSLAELEQKFQSQQDQLLQLVRSENTLTENLMTCELILNNTKEELSKLEDRHGDLKNRHNRIKTVLGIRERELIDCYAAKTQTFCGFEDANVCGFTQPNDTSDFFNWDWGQGETPSRNTGPEGDHTCGSKNGHFMFIEASAKSRGMNAIIYSPLYRGMEQQCLEFFYHMNGRHIGTLNVYARARGGTELASVWRAYGNQGDIWSVARLSIPRELARAGYQIAFEGITENGYQGDMAIDDVSVTDGKCPEGVQIVQVQFNVTGSADEILDESKRFARMLRKKKLGRIRQPRGKKHRKHKAKHNGVKDNDADEVKDKGVKDKDGDLDDVKDNDDDNDDDNAKDSDSSDDIKLYPVDLNN